jgi:hypothetical protein
MKWYGPVFAWVDGTKWFRMNSFRCLEYSTNMLYHLIRQKWQHHIVQDKLVHMLDHSSNQTKLCTISYNLLVQQTKHYLHDLLNRSSAQMFM